MNRGISSNLAPSSVESFQRRPIQESGASSTVGRSGILDHHAITQVSNPSLRTLDSVVSSSNVSNFFNYLGSRLTSSMSAVGALSNSATRRVARGIEHLASSLPPPEETFVDPLLETAGSYVGSAVVNHVIPNAQRVSGGIGHLSELASSLVHRQEGALQPLETPLELENQDDYVLISHSGKQHEHTAPAAPPRHQITLTPEEFYGLLDHDRNVSEATANAEHQDRLLEAEADAEDLQDFQKMSDHLQTLRLNIDKVKAETQPKIEAELQSELEKITEAFKNPERL